MKLLCLFLLLSWVVFGQSTPYTKFAGGNPGPYSGDGGPAVNAVLWTVEGLAADRFGNVYISQPMVGAGGGLVRRVDSTGRITAFAGGRSERAAHPGRPRQRQQQPVYDQRRRDRRARAGQLFDAHPSAQLYQPLPRRPEHRRGRPLGN